MFFKKTYQIETCKKQEEARRQKMIDLINAIKGIKELQY